MLQKNPTTERSTKKVNVQALYHKRRADTNRRIKEEFTLNNATAYGGYNLLADYIDKKKVETMIREGVDIEKADWSTYDFSCVLRHLIEGYALGMERTKQFEIIESDSLITEKHGVEKLPDYTTLNNDLKRFKTESDIRGLKDADTKLIKEKLRHKRDNIVYDFDCTVKTVYGEQEGAGYGYNPEKPGRPSYNTLMCFDGTEDLHIGSILRGGDVHSSTGNTGFMEEIDNKMSSIVKRYKKLKKRQKVLARFDQGFDSEDTYEKAEGLGWGYVGKARCFKPLKLNIFGIKRWRKIKGNSRDIEVCSMRYKAGKWNKERRVVIIRWRDDGGTQGSFFDEVNYNYIAFVTNLDWAEEDIYRFYNNRATVENRIKESKYGFGIDKIPTGEFYANYAALQLMMMAYNLISMFQEEVMEMGAKRMSVQCIRKKFFLIAGKIKTEGRQKILKLAENYTYKDKYLRMRERLAFV